MHTMKRDLKAKGITVRGLIRVPVELPVRFDRFSGKRWLEKSIFPTHEGPSFLSLGGRYCIPSFRTMSLARQTPPLVRATGETQFMDGFDWKDKDGRSHKWKQP